MPDNFFRVKRGLVVNGSGSTILDIQGSQGQLFSITDSLSGSLFAVKDISGIPVLEAFSDNTVKLGTFNQEGLIVSGSSNKFGFNQLSTHTFTGSVSITGSLNSPSITGSLFGTSSWASNAVTSSYVLQAVSASFAATASSADNFLVRNALTASSALITGTITAQTLVVSTVSSSVVYSSGSNIFGNSVSNVQQFTGSLRVTGSGDHYILGGNVGIGTATPATKLSVITSAGGNTNGFSVGSSVGLLNIWGGVASGLVFDVTNGTLNGSTGTSWFFRQGGVTTMLLDATGNVGIGTTSPTNKLDVSGSIGVNTSGQTRTISTFYGAGSDGFNIFIGGGGLSSGTGGGSSSNGSNNTSVGVSALNANTTGFSNTANGVSALFNNTTGASNVAVGITSLRNNTTGNNNTALGTFAGRFISGGSTSNTITNNSIFLGYNTKALADNQTNQIVIGYDETGLGSNTTIIGNSSTVTTAIRGRLLLGTTTDNGTDRLQVSGSASIAGNLVVTGSVNITGSLTINGGEIFAGRIDNGNEGGQVSFGRALDNNNGWYIDVYGNTSTPSLRFVDVSTAAVRMTISGSGAITMGQSLAVGPINPSAVAGRIDASNDVVAFSTSDSRFKENIQVIPNALDKIDKIHGYTFDWKEDKNLNIMHGFVGHDVGVIAQEIEKVLPEVVTTRDNGYKAVKYEKIVPLLIQAIKEQQKEINELRETIKNKL